MRTSNRILLLEPFKYSIIVFIYKMFNRGKNVITLDENWTLLDRNLEDDVCNICQRAWNASINSVDNA